MKKNSPASQLIFFGLFLSSISCKPGNEKPSIETINSLDLKQGNLISCGPAEKEFGAVDFGTSCAGKTTKDFSLAMALLHSFEYDEAEKLFAAIIAKEPDCAMAYWGVAMSNYHPLWDPPTRAELEKGSKAVAVAESLEQKTRMETEFINAIGMLYKDWKAVDHRTRSVSYKSAMEKIYQNWPGNKEAAIFYALALIATSDPADKSFANQKKAGDILSALYREEPAHPGIVHYIIHAYDFPGLATLALPAARKYASVAPSSAHAQHMPAHIFIRLGLWDECIQSSLASTAAAKCYAENTGMKAHWDEELHGMDYLVYAYLQKGENDLAKEQCEYLKGIHQVYPVNFKDAYAFASIPSRYLLENKLWKEAAKLKIHPASFPWQRFPWQKAIFHFTRLMGSANTGEFDSAMAELKILKSLYVILTKEGDWYKAEQVMIQVMAGEAWILFKQGQQGDAVKLMTMAADREDRTEKHPVTPGEILPARELLGDMFFQLNEPGKALIAYEADLRKQPNRFNGLYYAGLAAEKMQNSEKAKYYYQQLINIANSTTADRPELDAAKLFLKNHPHASSEKDKPARN